MKSNIKNAVVKLRLSDTAKTRIKSACRDVSKSNERQYIKTTRRGMRVAVIAACFCIFASVTAIAISELYPQISRKISEKDYSAYYIGGNNIVCHDLSNFSDELASDLESTELQRFFAERDALEEYIGIKLIDSAVLQSATIVEDLDESIQYGWKLDSAIVEYPDARYVVSEIVDGDNSTSLLPREIKISAHRVVKNSEVILSAHILTEYAENGDVSDVLAMQFYPTAQMIHTLTPDENGGFTWQTEHFRSAEHKFETSV